LIFLGHVNSGLTGPKFTKFSHCSGIIAVVTVTARIGVAIFQFVLKRYCKERRWCQSSIFLVPKI